MAAMQLDTLHEAVSRLDEVWTDASDTASLDRAGLIAANEALGALHRVIDGLHAQVAGSIAHESRRELGPDSLAKQQGFRTAAQWIAATSGMSTGEASRLVRVGESTAARSDLLGSPLPAKYPAIQSALASGALGVAPAALIIALLERVRLKVDAETIIQAESLIVGKTPGLSLDEVRKLVTRAEAYLDPDGIAPSEDEHHTNRSLHLFERDGMLHVNGRIPVEAGAAIKAAIQGFVSATFAARKDALDPDAPDSDRRTVAQLQADALAALCQHAVGCANDAPALAGATVVVRVSLTDLIAGTGSATIDGIDQPISISAVRRMAASGGVIPAVLGTRSEILDWGREKRFFTRAQRMALAERDGGCAMCALPPSMTRAHHLDWWHRDHGRTDLDRGVLLCENCHHRVHNNGWEIRVEGTGVAARVWFIPPPYVDPSRAPRLGGNARYSLAA